MDPVNTEGTVVAPKEICLRNSLTDGSGFLSGGLRLRTSASYKASKSIFCIDYSSVFIHIIFCGVLTGNLRTYDMIYFLCNTYLYGKLFLL